ncbi:MAG: hypothetical protein AAGE92_05045, partial [Cyanobacteria bacterium P01_G01_bin.4]
MHHINKPSRGIAFALIRGAATGPGHVLESESLSTYTRDTQQHKIPSAGCRYCEESLDHVNR